MNMIKVVKTLVPTAVKSELKKIIYNGAMPRLSANNILGSLYSPPLYEIDEDQESPERKKKVSIYDVTEDGKLTWTRGIAQRSMEDPYPVPPPDLRMSYAFDSDAKFLSWGENTSKSIRRIIDREGIGLTAGTSVMEWGCASGRVLRHFAQEAKHCEFWGVDQDSPHIIWAKQNLSPPFKFVTCTAYPHLPFEDNKFKLVYAMSVFTHLLHLVDMWLMEFRRILAPGGYALFTIHDEHTWQYLSQHQDERRGWLENEDFSKELGHDVVVFARTYTGSRSHYWNQVFTFFKTDWIRREWGQYFDVVSLEPLSDDYRTTVVLRKSL